MKILLVYPKYPDTFWGFKHALKFVSKKAIHPPLGLLTVAAMLPENWRKKVVDMNVEKLKDKHLEWADYVFISGMVVQKDSALEIIKKCNDKNIKVIAGGPLFTAAHKDFEGVDHFVLNEAEVSLKPFIDDLLKGEAKRVYRTDEHPEITETPVPLYELIKKRRYNSMNIQYSRGCPFNCDFCDITTLLGKRVRTKSKYQIIAELESLYSQGWRGNVFFVDDNFIGNKVKIKEEILPAIIGWMKRRGNPFIFSTEASINLADDEKLMRMMVRAGFETVFVGIETPDEKSLQECSKFQNKNRSLVDSIKKIQKFGLEVTGGFIVGFDSDSPSTFGRQVELIQKSGIVTAMVGLLNALKNTPLYHRLKSEDRLLNKSTGNNTDFSINFKTKMEYKKLIEGYQKIIKDIYSVKPYYTRVRGFLEHTQSVKKKAKKIKIAQVAALFKSMLVLGVKDKGRVHYWRLFFWSLFKSPRQFPLAITFAIYGYHFRRIFQAYL